MERKGPSKVQRAILSKLGDQDPQFEYKWNNTLGIPNQLRGKLSAPSTDQPMTVVRRFMDEHKNLYQVENVDQDLRLIRIEKAPRGATRIRLQQTWQGVPVYGSQLLIQIAADNSIQRITGEFLPEIKAAPQPSITPTEAVEAAQKHAGEASVIPGQEPQLEVFHQDGEATLCWHVSLDGFEEDKLALWEYFINAENGEVVFRYNNMMFHTSTTGHGRGRYAGCVQLNTTHNHGEGTYQLQDTTRPNIAILTYDAGGTTNLDTSNLSSSTSNQWNNTNRVPRSNSQEAEVDAHYYLGVVVDYYQNIHGRSSYDNAGSDAEICVHHGDNFDNAFWNVARNRIYLGDGDGTDRDYWSALDIIAHEFTHGVTAHSCSLNYYYFEESAALHEAISDFFAAMIQEDWVFGEQICLGATAPDDAMRSLFDPTPYGDPDHYTDYDSSAGAHVNCNIISKAGYLLTHGGTHHNIEVFGLGRAIAERIWYEGVQNLTPSSDFEDFRQALIDACTDLYPGNAWRRASVQNAMAAVGIGDSVAYPNCPALVIVGPCMRLDELCFNRLEMVEGPPEEIGPCSYLVETTPCVYRSEVDPCIYRAELVPCLYRTETGGCCSRELILEPRPGCSLGDVPFEQEVGPCCSRELILEPTNVCHQGDIPVYNLPGCPRETLVVGRLTEAGRFEPLPTPVSRPGDRLRHVRILTAKPRK